MRYGLLDVDREFALGLARVIHTQHPDIVVYAQESATGVWSVHWWGPGSLSVRDDLEECGYPMQWCLSPPASG